MEALARSYTIEKTLADKVNDRLAELKMSKAELAIKLNYSRSAVSMYLNGKYNSDPTALESSLEEFLIKTSKYVEGSSEKEVIAIKPIKEKVQYFESNDYIGVIGVCSLCQENMGIGIVVGRSGYGKTHTLKRFAKMPRVAYIECNETMACKDLIRKIENQIGLPRSYGTIDDRLDGIINFFNVNQGYLLIVDEADKLINKYTQKKIEILRIISDRSDAGVVIAGEPRLESHIKAYDERFANRMDFYYKLKGLTKEEVTGYLEGFEIEESAMNELITRACNTQTGCFRLLDRTLNNIIRILKENKSTKVTMKVIKEASNMMML